MNYYSGLVFRGFLKNLAAGVLSGGQYDKMVEKMGKRCGAMGFAIYLNELERLGPARPQYDADVLVLYDDTTDLQALTRRLAALAGQGKRALARRQAEGLQGKGTLDLRGGKQAGRNFSTWPCPRAGWGSGCTPCSPRRAFPARNCWTPSGS